MSKYIEMLNKANQTLTKQRDELKEQNEKLLQRNKELMKENYKLIEDNKILEGMRCKNNHLFCKVFSDTLGGIPAIVKECANKEMSI